MKKLDVVVCVSILLYLTVSVESQSISSPDTPPMLALKASLGNPEGLGWSDPDPYPDDPENFFTLRVHHGGEFDERMLPMGYWIQLSGYGMPFNRACDKDLLWFGDKVPEDKVYSYEIIDDDHNGAQAAEEGDGPEVFGDGPHVDGEKAYSERDRKGKQVQVDPKSNDDGGDLVESNYEQEVEDITAETCYDPSNLWDTFTFPRTECGSGFYYEKGSENLSSLDGSEAEEDEGVQPRKFIKIRYHEFTPKRDMQNPVFRLDMEFDNADVFRKAVRAHFVKHRRVVKFKKNDPNGLGQCARLSVANDLCLLLG
ncbi:hypothetical protein LWI29_032076 [Acer saccharum]|uniref:Uncharacterized protein n=1 Tax=Acer saccharum TaxID=4024 RepID=A0AA39TLN9_ACESA|nr:hypothetical protein LWI29_032076 [Acer saccharum]